MKRKGKQGCRGFDAVAAVLGVVAMIICAAAVWVLALVAMSLASCSTAKYIPCETVRTEYRDKIKEVRATDSIVDTRFVYVKGDTVIDYRDRVKWRDRHVHDSIFIENNDTIREPYPIERKLTRWEQTKMDLGGVAMGGFAIAVCFAVVWLVKRFKR